MPYSKFIKIFKEAGDPLSIQYMYTLIIRVVYLQYVFALQDHSPNPNPFLLCKIQNLPGKGLAIFPRPPLDLDLVLIGYEEQLRVYRETTYIWIDSRVRAGLRPKLGLENPRE